MAERGGLFDDRPVRRILPDPDAVIDRAAWPATVPAVAQLLRDGLELPRGVTFLVGENGSGKSTVIEGIATAYGMPPEGGSTNGSHVTRPSESPLGGWLRIERSLGTPRWGFFLRAETMHGYYTYLESLPQSPDTHLHQLSHGESFNDLLANKLNHPAHVTGFACLDEPEAALSFGSTLKWLAELNEMAARGTQVLCATHSPVLAALPGAHILELGEWGMRETAWEDLEIVMHWRSFLDAPERYFRHLL
ncbi:AAA family ATPase [Leifsonia sp. NPDC077715]|uniref:AAA family ATPase n=1 Tax=Leifsonia sp. NPDC077715 TaxID=3155539 RepID=UPI003437B26E